MSAPQRRAPRAGAAEPAEVGYPHGAAPSGYGPALARSGATAHDPWLWVGMVLVPVSARVRVVDADGTVVDVLGGQCRELQCNGALVRYRLTGFVAAGEVRDVWVYDLATAADAQRATLDPAAHAQRTLAIAPATQWRPITVEDHVADTPPTEPAPVELPRATIDVGHMLAYGYIAGVLIKAERAEDLVVERSSFREDEDEPRLVVRLPVGGSGSRWRVSLTREPEPATGRKDGERG